MIKICLHNIKKTFFVDSTIELPAVSNVYKKRYHHIDAKIIEKSRVVINHSHWLTVFLNTYEHQIKASSTMAAVGFHGVGFHSVIVQQGDK